MSPSSSLCTKVIVPDAVILLTDHDAFDLDAVRIHASYVLDTRRRLLPAETVEYL